MTPIPETHREYWKTLYHLVMRGQLSEACKLLLAHSQAHTNPAVSLDHVSGVVCHVTYAVSVQVFESMAEVLSSAPMCVSTVGRSRGELHRRWGDWKREVAHRNQMGDYGTSWQLQLLAKVRGSGMVEDGGDLFYCRFCVEMRRLLGRKSEFDF